MDITSGQEGVLGAEVRGTDLNGAAREHSLAVHDVAYFEGAGFGAGL